MSNKLKVLSTAVMAALMIAQAPSVGAKGKPTVDNILPLEHVCSQSLFFKVQDMTQQQFQDSCQEVGAEEGYFHNRMETNWQPVDGDLNEDLRMVVFDDYTNYNRYGGRLFGINTNNGGMYIEGNATDPNNQASFYAHEADWLRPDFVIWNLKHEYVHYLDGRFNLKGNFADYPSNTVWWSEGTAEYISKEDSNADAVALISTSGSNRTLADVLATTYNNTVEEIYDWGYLGSRFMFELHMPDVRNLRQATRAGDWSTYQQLLTQWGSTYEQQWQDWLVELAGGSTGGGSGGGSGGSGTLLSETVDATQGSWARYSVTAANTGNLDVLITGGTGDADLYVKNGSEADTNNWDCRPYKNGNEESCSLSVTSGDSVSIGVYAYNAFSNVSLTATN